MKRIILAGGSGFLGSVLAGYFSGRGWEVVILTRSARAPERDADRGVRWQSEATTPLSGCGRFWAKRPGASLPAALQSTRSVVWDGCSVGAWQSELEGAEVVINLSGRSVNCRYTRANRGAILRSRVDSTRVLGQAIARCCDAPRVWLNSSTATLYKHTFDQPMDEVGEIGAAAEAKDAFSIQVGQAWEQALEEAVTPRTRKVAMRTTMVLGLGRNSVFPVLRRLVRLGLGGKMGWGDQFVSWIHEADFCRAVEWVIAHEELGGPINFAAPNPVRNREMMKTLRHICGVSIGLPATPWMLEVGAFFLRTETELIIKSRRAIPRRLLESGFEFQFPLIRQAFEDLASREK